MLDSGEQPTGNSVDQNPGAQGIGEIRFEIKGDQSEEGSVSVQTEHWWARQASSGERPAACHWAALGGARTDAFLGAAQTLLTKLTTLSKVVLESPFLS